MKQSFTRCLVGLMILGGTVFAQIPNSAYVVNSTGENLSRINIDDQTVTSDAAALGLFANQVVLNGGNAYVVNSGLNAIQVIDLATMNTLKNIETGQGTNPWAIEFVNDSLAAISLLLTNQVIFVNVNSSEIVETVTVGNGPEGMQYHNEKLYVANSGFVYPGFVDGVVSVISISDFSVSDISVGINPQALDVDLDGNIVVACTGNFVDINGEIDVIDTSADTVLYAEPVNTGITFVAVNAANKAYFSTFGSGVLVYNLTTRSMELDENNTLPGGPGLAIDSDDNVYITDFSMDSVYVYSAAHERLNAFLVGVGPNSIAIFENISTGITEIGNEIPDAFTLQQNYPNPFNPETSIRFAIRKNSRVTLNIFNALGAKVSTLVNENLPAGSYEFRWDAQDSNGNKVPSGIYFYQLTADNISTVKKMTLIR